MKKISLKGASWDSMLLSVSKVLAMLFNIISAKMLSMGLTKLEYGTYSQANIINEVGASIILMGMPDALNYFYHRKEEGYSDETRKKVVNTVFFLEIVMGAVLAACILFGQDLVAVYFDNDKVKQLLPYVSLLPMFANVIYFYQTLAVTVGKAKLMTVFSILITLSRILAVYLAVYVFHSLIWIYLMILLMDVTQVVVFHLAIRKKDVRINPIKIEPKYIKKIFIFGLPMGIYALTSTLTRDLDKLVIGRFADTESLAIYSNASKLLPLSVIVVSFAMVLIPYVYRRVAEGKREESADLFSSYLKVGYYSVWTLGAMVLVAPESIISFLYADTYIVGKNIFILYIFDSMLRFANVHLILVAAGKSRLVMYYSLLSLGLNFVLNLLFYYLWGMIGPAIATLVVALVYTLLILGSTIKTIEAKWSDIFEWKDVGRFTLILLATYLVAFFMNRGLLALGLHRYLAMLLSMAAMGLAVLGLYRKQIFGVLKKINAYKL